MVDILIIEDDKELRMVMAEALSFEYDVFVAENGRVGVEEARKHHPDLIICDIMMPEMDGFEVLITLRDDTDTESIPFIFSTAIGEYETMRRAMNLGADDFVRKPFELDELFSAVKASLVKKRIREEALQQLMDNMRNNIVMALPHELRTSIMVVQGYSGILLEDAQQSDPEKAMMIEMIQKYTDRLHKLSEKFYWYSVTELLKAGHKVNIPVEDAPHTIQTIAYEIAGEFERLEDLQLEIEAGKPYVQEDHFDIIIREIIENAFKFSDTGNPVSVWAYCEDNKYHIQITDNGRGMAAKQIKETDGFMQFEREIYEQQGTGLGLTIAKRLAKVTRGKIDMVSQEQGGTQVTISLPLM